MRVYIWIIFEYKHIKIDSLTDWYTDTAFVGVVTCSAIAAEVNTHQNYAQLETKALLNTFLRLTNT